MKVSAVIPVHNSRVWLESCLPAVLHQAGADVSVAVVDNASTDGTAEAVRRQWPAVTVLELTRNVGYGSAINEGVRTLPRGHVLALDADAQLDPGCLQRLLDVLVEDPRVGAVAPRLLNADRTLHASAHQFPTVIRLLAEAVGLSFAPVFGRLADPHLRHFSHESRVAVDWITGAVLLVREQAWRMVGGFDPAYFFYGEDLDLQYRLSLAGFASVLEPSATAVHFGGKRPIPPEVFLAAHEGIERFVALRSGRGPAAMARAALCLTALTRMAGWAAIGAASHRRRPEAWSWARMFARVLLRSTGRIGRISQERLRPYDPSAYDSSALRRDPNEPTETLP